MMCWMPIASLALLHDFAVEHKFALLLKQCLTFIEANAKAVIFAVGLFLYN